MCLSLGFFVKQLISKIKDKLWSSSKFLMTVPLAFIIINTFYDSDYLYHYQNALQTPKYKIYTVSLRRARGAPTTHPLRSRRPHSVVTASPQAVQTPSRSVYFEHA